MKDQTKDLDLKAAVVDRITKEGIKPHGKSYWLLIDVVVWGLWFLAVLVGALAVAVLLFASLQMSFELHEATHDSTLEFILEWLPLIWLLVLVAMSAAAYFNMRHTKRGYKYPLSVIILSSIGGSIMTGFILHFIGVGYYVDTYLGRAMPMYHSQEMMGAKNWQMPEAGRLVGQFVGEFEKIEAVRFEDMNGSVWQVDVEELRPIDLRLARSGETVRIVGVMATNTPNTIHGCGVFPWHFDELPTLDELKEQRRLFVERMGLDEDEILEKNESLHEVEQGFCHPMPIVKRPRSR